MDYLKLYTLKDKLLIPSLLFFLLPIHAHLCAQEILFPDLNGPELLEAVQANYTPTLNLSYSEARDTLYSRIDLEQDSVHGIYTDFAVYLTPNTDPTITLFAGGLNTEHIYPQGRGATDGTPAHRNMHHLAASRAEVNQDRGNLPFADIADQTTDKWYFLEDQMSTIPISNIDSYSEGTGLAFEPRESVKGNVARAVFYIHAIYREQVMAEDPTFFAMQQDDLCAWHFSDPIDDEELWRTQQIAVYQDGKENPFVLDCTLAQRMYCNGQGNCSVASQEPEKLTPDIFECRIDEEDSQYLLMNKSNQTLVFSYSIYSIGGYEINSNRINQLQPNNRIVLPELGPPGAYILFVKTDRGIVFSKVLISY